MSAPLDSGSYESFGGGSETYVVAKHEIERFVSMMRGEWFGMDLENALHIARIAKLSPDSYRAFPKAFVLYGHEITEAGEIILAAEQERALGSAALATKDQASNYLAQQQTSEFCAHQETRRNLQETKLNLQETEKKLQETEKKLKDTEQELAVVHDSLGCQQGSYIAERDNHRATKTKLQETEKRLTASVQAHDRALEDVTSLRTQLRDTQDRLERDRVNYLKLKDLKAALLNCKNEATHIDLPGNERSYDFRNGFLDGKWAATDKLVALVRKFNLE